MVKMVISIIDAFYSKKQGEIGFIQWPTSLGFMKGSLYIAIQNPKSKSKQAVWILDFGLGPFGFLDFGLGAFGFWTFDWGGLYFGSLMFGGRIEQHVWILHQIFLTHADSGRRTFVEFSKNNRWIVCCKDVVFLHVFHCSLFCSPQSNYLSERDHQPAGRKAFLHRLHRLTLLALAVAIAIPFLSWSFTSPSCMTSIPTLL